MTPYYSGPAPAERKFDAASFARKIKERLGIDISSEAGIERLKESSISRPSSAAFWWTEALGQPLPYAVCGRSLADVVVSLRSTGYLSGGDSWSGYPIVRCPICDETTLRDDSDLDTCPICNPSLYVEATEHGMPFPYYQRVPAATGPTQRLQHTCSACQKELPADAAFCIWCGVTV